MSEEKNMRPHRRYNPLTGEWILVSPHRTQRPWLGKQETLPVEQRPEFDPGCYLCPGNERANGEKNPDYKSTFVFRNDFSALLPDTIEGLDNTDQLFQNEYVKGMCKVLCFSPRHDLTLPEMEVKDIVKVIELWSDEVRDLSQKYLWIQVFENKGELMGCSNPHPHGQIWAGSFMPNEPLKEDHFQDKYYREKDSVLLLEYLKKELEKKERIILENDHWVTLVPYWAVWPFETLLLPRRHVGHLTDLDSDEIIALAEILKRHLSKYDNLFETSFPYSMGWHGIPFDHKDNSHWQLHAHFYPPLLRSASVKKFMVGYEMLAEAQRDITAEQATDKLKKVSDIHFKVRRENV